MIGELTVATIFGIGGGMIGDVAMDPLTTGKALVFTDFAIAFALESRIAVLRTTPQAFNVVETICVHLRMNNCWYSKD